MTQKAQILIVAGGVSCHHTGAGRAEPCRGAEAGVPGICIEEPVCRHDQ